MIITPEGTRRLYRRHDRRLTDGIDMTWEQEDGLDLMKCKKKVTSAKEKAMET